MATWKGLSSSLIVQIVTHLLMKKVTKFEEETLSGFRVMLQKPLEGGWIPPPVEIGLKPAKALAKLRRNVAPDIYLFFCLNEAKRLSLSHM